MKQMQTPYNVKSKIYKSYFVEISEGLGLSHRDHAVMRSDDVQEGLNLPYPEVDREKLVQVLEALYYCRTALAEAGGVTTMFYTRSDLRLRVDYLLNSTVVGLL